MKKLSLLSGHVLRLLATFHWIREVTPDVFTNNRLSSYIDSGKSAEQLKNACVLFLFACSRRFISRLLQSRIEVRRKRWRCGLLRCWVRPFSRIDWFFDSTH